MNKAKHVAAWALPVLALASQIGPARADEHMVLVDTIDVNSAKGLGLFDISFVDPSVGCMSCRTAQTLRWIFFNAREDTFIGRVGGFVGVTLNPATGLPNNGLSGPDGVTIVGDKEVWAGDGDSTVKVIDIASFAVVDKIDTGGKFRCDEMSWDSADHILAVANNADTPPFVTLINTDYTPDPQEDRV